MSPVAELDVVAPGFGVGVRLRDRRRPTASMPITWPGATRSAMSSVIVPGPQPTSRIDVPGVEVGEQVRGRVLDGPPPVRAQHRFVVTVRVAGRLRVGHSGVGYGPWASPTSEAGSSAVRAGARRVRDELRRRAARSARRCACTSTVEPVVDLWGGVADATTGRRGRRTRSCSCTRRRRASRRCAPTC